MSPLAQVNQTVLTSQETLEASIEVINHRLGLMGEAMADPRRADHAELTLMGAEKLEALGASTTALFAGTMQMAQQSCQMAEREAAHSTDLLHALSHTTSLDQAAALQTQWGMQALSRLWDNGLNLTQAMLGTQARALSPIHQTVTANAQRLKAKT